MDIKIRLFLHQLDIVFSVKCVLPVMLKRALLIMSNIWAKKQSLRIKLMKGKALRKHSLHEKTATE